MDSISLTHTRNASTFGFSIPCFSNPRQCKNLSFPRKLKKFVVFASKDEQQLNSWDQMELKFGKLIGEDPKLTMAKIIGRKLNPEMTYLEIEKSFNKRKGKYEIEEVPFDVSDGRKSPDSLDRLNLVRPVPKKGVKFETSDKPLAPRIKRPSQPVVKAVDNPQVSVPNVILRRPSTYNDDDIGTEKSPRLSIKPNLSLRMGNEQPKERFSDMTLVRKPAPFLKKEGDPSEEAKGEGSRNTEDNIINSVPVATGRYTDFSLLQKPERMNYLDPEASADHSVSSSDSESSENGLRTVNSTAEMENVTNINVGSSWDDGDVSKIQDLGQGNNFLKGSQPLEQSDIVSAEKSSAATIDTEKKVANSDSGISIEAALKGRPERLDQPVKESSKIGKGALPPVNPESYGNALDYENLPATPLLKEREDADWRRAEDLIKTTGRADVELISSSTRGFVASFGSLIGFLPYRNLATKWKYLAFESWLRRKGVDPSMYRQSLGIIGTYDATNNVAASDSRDDSKIVSNAEGEISSDMKLEELLSIYDREKLKYLSSFVGQKVKVNVILADRASRKLIFSVKPKEKEESIEKKRSLMAKLSVGDVVKCCIKKITYFGVFVEVEGVPALIHQTEVSWDAALDPTSYFKIGQVLEAKVHQLDFSLERIFLSLKEITPDPLTETLEAVVGDRAFMDGRLQAAQAEDEWADVESLVKELQQYEGVQSVSKGRFFLSPGLAPAFQVYMGSMFEDQYKLLARAGNKVQEVIVQTSLNKEEMKSAILTCTNRVE